MLFLGFRRKPAREPSPNQRCLFPRLGLVWRRDVWPGLVRYSLRQQRANAGWRVYVHHFSVTDSEVHNHPWAWGLSLILRGQYTERFCDHRPEGPYGERVVSAGQVNWIPLSRYHQVTGFPADGGCWTLFCCGPSVDAAHGGGQ